MENLDLRIMVSDYGLTYKAIASELGISRVYLSQVMSRPLKPHMKEKILKAMRTLKEKGEEECGRLD